MNDIKHNIELCKICKINLSSIDNRLTHYPGLIIKEPCPTCDNCKERWLDMLSKFMETTNENSSGIYTFENEVVKEISKRDWHRENPGIVALGYYKDE